jgi:histone deacetylase 1/2
VTGWIATLNGDPVSWASKKQKVVAQSTCEAELYAEAAAINEAKWLSDLVSEMGFSTSTPVIFGDNQSTQALSKNGIKSERTKHVAIKYAFIFDEVAHNRIHLQWVPTDQQWADMLTKALSYPILKSLREKVLVD